MKAASNPQNEPDFYSMKVCPPSTPSSHDGEMTLDLSSDNPSFPMEIEDGDEDEEQVSQLVEEQDIHPATTETYEFRPPAVVTPTASPRQSLNLSSIPPSMFLTELPEPQFIVEDKVPSSTLLPQVNSSRSIVSEEDDESETELRSGDEVFFEGLKFRYLDHLDLECTSHNTFIDYPVGPEECVS